jgi:DNA-binding beta-propeller fold protein YncE
MKQLMCLILSASAVFAAEGYHVTNKIKVGGSGVWDRQTLDEAGRRLYISSENRVVVVDLDAGKVAGEIPGTAVRGIAIAPELGKGFIANGGSNDVTIFDLKTLKATGKVDAGLEPGPVVYEPKTGRVFTFNLSPDDQTATVIDAKAGTAAGKVTIGGKATAGVADGTGKIYIALQITNEDWNVSSEIGVIDAEKLTLARHSPITPCDRPADVALDAKNHRIIAACNNAKASVVDAETGKVISTLTIGKPSAGAGFDAGTGLAFTAAGDGTMAVLKDNAGKVEIDETVQTLKGARTLSVDPKTHNVYLAADEGGLTILVAGK